MSKKPIIAYVLSVIITLFCFAASKGNCQTSTTPSVYTPTQEEFSIAWLKDLYEPGVTMQADSLVINKEAEHLLNDAAYRQTMGSPTVHSKIILLPFDIPPAAAITEALFS